MSQKTPLVFDDVSRQHRPLNAGETIVTSAIPVSPVADNILKVTPEGLLVQSDDSTPTVSPLDENFLRYAADGGLFVGGNDVLSNGDDNLLRIDSIDHRIKLTAQDVKNAAGAIVVVSADAGNILTKGTDKGAYLSAQVVTENIRLSSDAGNALTRDASGALYAQSSAAGDLISADAGNNLQLGSDAKLYVDVPAANDLISSDAGNNLQVGADSKLYVDVPAANDLISSDAGNIITPGTDAKLFARLTTAADIVDATDKILVVSNDGKTVSTAFTATYDAISGNLSFLGKNGEQIAQVFIQSQGSVLESVTVVTDPPGMPPGTYLAMTFRKNDGSTETVYADLSAVGDVYTAGSGIDITNRVISAKVTTGGGLEVTPNGLQISSTAVAGGLISTDSGNMIMPGSDGLLYAPMDCGEIV